VTGKFSLTSTASIGGTVLTLEADVSDAGRVLKIGAASGVSLEQVWDQIRNFLPFDLPALPSEPDLWAELTQTKLSLSAFVASQPDGSIAASIDLTYVTPVSIPSPNSTFGKLFGTFATVEGLVLAYKPGDGGLTIQAKVQTPTMAPAASAPKTQLVGFPFPVPAQSAPPVFKLNYLGIGQRVGPDPVIPGQATAAQLADPLAAVFGQLETDLLGSDPAVILNRLARDFYKPDRDWFVAADVSLRGFRVRALFNDPAMYGLEITVASSPPNFFSGLLFEILYEKLGPGLGVYYGALTLPDAMRRIDIDGIILILPGFSIWVYTNGDFQLNVGWPLGPSSIGIIVGPLTGQAGFTFAKLRSADDPSAGQDTPDFNPILQFGIAFDVYASVDCSAGPLSASLSVTLDTLLQGVIAWTATKAADSTPDTAPSIAGPPDYYWFAGSASLVILVQGSIDFTIIKATLSIQLSAQLSVAYETGHSTLIAVSAEVSVSLSVHMVIVTVHLSFHMRVSHSFQLGGGDPAQISGPSAKGLVFTPLSATATETTPPPPAAPAGLVTNATSGGQTATSLPPAPAARLTADVQAARQAAFALVLGATGPTAIGASFALLPTATFTTDSGEAALVAALILNCPTPDAAIVSTLTDFETMAAAMLRWALGKMPPATATGRLQALGAALGHGSDAPSAPFGGRDDFITLLHAGLAATLKLTISGVTGPPPATEVAGAPLPMPAGLLLTVGAGTPVALGAVTPSTDDVNAINARYDGLGLGPSTPANGTATSQAHSLADLMMADYMLLLLRQLVGSLVPPSLAGDSGTDIAAALSVFDFAQLSGFASRFLVAGMQLPDPSDASRLVPLFALTGQQFAAGSGLVSATLVPPAGMAWIVGTATADITLPATAPVKPAYVEAAASPPSPGQWVARQISGLALAPLRVALNQRTAVQGSATIGTLLNLPTQILPGPGATAGLSLSLSIATPDGGGAAAPACAASLLVALSISRVQQPGAFLPGIYQLRGTDDATRELLYALLQAYGLLGAQPQPAPPVTLLTSFPGSQALATVGTKVLTGDPAAAPTLMLVRTIPPAPPDTTESANANAAPGVFLRLLWEACVAQGNGTFLYDNTCLGGAEDQVFAAGPAATIDLLVSFPPPATTGGTVAVPAWANRLAMGTAVPTGTVMATVGNAMTASAATPAGSVGFAVDIARTPAPPLGQQDIVGLYHLVQFAAVAVTPQWSLPIGPTDPAAGANPALWSYQQTFPIPVASANPYAAIGQTLPLQFRLIDIFGNPLPDALPASAPGVSVSLRYTDKLIAPAMWPGVRVAYTFQPGAQLQLLVSFDAASLQASFQAAPASIDASVARVTTIVNQLTDARVTAALTTDLDGGTARETATPLKAALLGFAQAILAALQGFAATKTLAAVPPLTLTRPIAFADVLAQTLDVLPVGVWITLARPAALADPDAPQMLPAAISVTSPVPPLLDQTGGATSTLTSFAQAFEAAFAAMPSLGRDPTHLRLAQRSATPSGDATGATPDLWAVRFGGAGFGLAVPATAAQTTYALRPLSTQLLSAPLPDDSMHNNIDLDATAATCLQAIDSALTPGRAVAVALLGTADPAKPGVTWLDRLLAAKRALAEAIPAGIAKVLPSDPDGDLGAARAALQTALLGSLANAASVSCVVQTGVCVAVRGTPGDALDVATAPVLLGDIGAVPATASGTQNNHFFFSSAGLTLAGTADLPTQPNQILTSLLSVAEPTGQTALAASLSWSPAFMRHDVETAETYAGFTPSAWLKFITAGDTLAPGNATIPLPLWLEPTRPALTSHAAAAAAGAGVDRSGTEDEISGLAADIALVLQWQYSAQLSVSLDVQDELWLDPGFNALPPPALAQGTLAPDQLAFFQAALGFALAVPGFAATLAALDSPPPTGAALTTLLAGIGQFVGFAEQLAATWPASGVVAATAPAQTPQGLMLTADTAANWVELRWPATATPPAAADWPTLGFGDPMVSAPPDAPAALTSDGTAWVQHYTVKTGLDLTKMTLSWAPLAFKDRISGDFRCWIARNPALVPGRPTADAFVFRTPAIGFPSPLVPLLVSAGLPRIKPSVPLAQILRALLDQLATVGNEATEPVVSIACTYCAQLLPNLTPGAGAAGLTMRMPVLMGTDVALPADTAAMAGTLTAEIAGWLHRTAPIERDAYLDFAVTLFAVPNEPGAQQLPLVRLDQVIVLLTGAADGFWATP
jgi:hypothetical protein